MAGSREQDMSDSFGMFEAAAGGNVEQERAQRVAADKLAAAVYDVKERFGDFILAATDFTDFNDRVALCKDDLIKTIEPHMFPRTGTVRRVIKALKDDFKKQSVQEAGPTDLEMQVRREMGLAGEDLDDPEVNDFELQKRYETEEQDQQWAERQRGGSRRSAADGDSEPLIPEGNFKGYLDSVDEGAPSKVDVNFTGSGTEHDMDPADHDFGKRDATRRWAADSTQPASPTSPIGQDSNNTDPGAMWNASAGPQSDPSSPVVDSATGQPPVFQPSPMTDVGMADAVGQGRITSQRRAADRFAAYCRSKGLKPTLGTLERIGSKLSDKDYLSIASALQRHAGPGLTAPANATKATGPEWNANGKPKKLNTKPDLGVADNDQPDLHVPGKAAGRRTAAPDYLQKANEALTNVLNQKAEEMQEEVAPLQQALQVVQQALQEQQAANPFNMMPGGSINVMPGGGGAPAGGAPAGGDPMAAMMGGGGDPAAGGGAPPMDPSMGGGMPPQGDPSMADPSMGGGMPPEAADPSQGGLPPELAQQMMARRRAASGAQRGGQGKARGRKATPRQADIVRDYEEWSDKRVRQDGALPTGSEADLDRFFNEKAKDRGERAKSKLRSELGVGSPTAERAARRRKKADLVDLMERQEASSQTKSSGHHVAGWEWDDYQNAHIASKPQKFACSCGQKFATPSGFHRCKCGKQWNSYVIGTGGDRHEASAEKYLVREVPVRKDVIVAKKRRQAADHRVEDFRGPNDGNIARNPYTGDTETGRFVGDPEGRGHWDKDDRTKHEAAADFARFLAEAYAAREASIVKLTEPGEIGEGEDPGTPTMKQQPSDWARRNPDGKWNSGPRKSLASHDDDDDFDYEDNCSHCRSSLDDGQGFDGFCGNCADVLESHRYWDGSRKNQERALEALEKAHPQ